MKKLVETFIENYSTNELFEFYVTCESCENAYGKTTKRFSKSGAVPTSQIEKTLWNALYEQEMRTVRQIAVRHAAEQMNYCPVCKRLVCNQCFACGGEEAPEASAPEAVDLEAKYGIDFAAEGEQKMSDERAAKSVLIETRDVWLEGKMTFALAENPKTYEDFVAHIGCDASSYTARTDKGERHFVWVSQEDETAQLLAVFWETPQGWTLYSIGATNLG